MNKTTLTLSLILLVSIMAGMQNVEVANANFFPGDALIIHFPLHNWVYSNTSVSLNIVASVAHPTPEVVNITYSLDENSNVTLTNLKETLRVPGHIDGSQFYDEVVLTKLSEGSHTIDAYSMDSSGRQMSASIEFIIDTSYTSPLSVQSPQNTTYTTTEIPLTFTCREDRKHDGKFSAASYVLDGIGYDIIDENVTLTDLSLTNHTITVIVWTENGFFSKTIHFTIKEPEPFPTTLVVASVCILAIVAIGVLVYFKKRRSEAESS